MRRTCLTLMITGLMLAPIALCAQESDSAYIARAKNATALLYSQDASGGMNMHCTATIFEKAKKGYRFVSAAHCVGNDDTSRERSASPDHLPFFITFDETAAPKVFYPAKVTLVGYQHRGEDFAVFEVETTQDWPVVPLGDEKKEVVPAPFWNVASPLGLGRQVLEGVISNLDLDRPIFFNDINWAHSLVLQMSGVNGGSSGSSLIAKDQRAIVGFLVGSIGDSTITAIPVSRFKLVLAAQAKGKYHWYQPKEEIDLGNPEP